MIFTHWDKVINSSLCHLIYCFRSFKPRKIFLIIQLEMEDPYKIKDLYSNIKDNPVFLSIDEFGFITDHEDDKLLTNKRLLRSEWFDLFDRFHVDSDTFKKQILHKGLLQRGIPILLRNKIWRILLMKNSNGYVSTSLQMCESYLNIKISKNMKECIEKERYDELKTKKCGYEYQIHVDIQRTFRKHYLFNTEYGKGQSELFHILVGFSNLNKEIGYCQGMSDICAIFLMHYSEFDAFVMMTEFFKRNKFLRFFENGFSKLQKLIRKQIGMIKILIPECFVHMKKHLETLEITMISWYLTLFTRFGIKLCLRIWDYMMFYGFGVCFYFICAVFKVHLKKIKELSDEGLSQFIGQIERMEVDENEVVDFVEVLMKIDRHKSLLNYM